MDDLEELYQLQLEEQEYEEFLANGLVLPGMRTQTDDRDQTSMGEKE